MTSSGAQRLVASAVVLVLTGTPVAASACALWCPPGAVHTAGDAARVVGTADPLSAATACESLHRHAAPGTPAASAVSADEALHSSVPADAASWTPAALVVAAQTACCTVPAIDAGRVAATAASPSPQAPPARLLPLDVRAVPPRVTHRPPARRLAAARAARRLVLRI